MLIWLFAVPLLVSPTADPPAFCGCPVIVLPCPSLTHPPPVPAAEMLREPPPTTGVPKYATPTAAPPSAERSEDKPSNQPEVSESHSAFESYISVPKPSEKVRPDRCVVRFWNLSKQPIRVRADGQTQSIAVGSSIQLDLPREFAWQINDREAQSAKVPVAAAGLDIVIRGEQ